MCTAAKMLILDFEMRIADCLLDCAFLSDQAEIRIKRRGIFEIEF
jgi:hypothetical protein